MKKDKINTLLRNYIKDNLSPTQQDIQFVASIYQSFNDLLGVNNCIQIGSFPRYTAIRPLHDLDILYIIGDWREKYEIPENLLSDLAKKFKQDYKNPTIYEIKIKVQTHSISFQYMKNDIEIFAVDIVPSLKRGLNEFGQDTYYVPEIIKIQRGEKRNEYYLNTIKNKTQIKWIKTDPRGYTEVASRLNKKNEDFRRSVKFAKGWKNHFKNTNKNFKLKSFHIEQLITIDYLKKNTLEIFDSLFIFFNELKENMKNPKIKDRGDPSKYIDEYLNDLTENEISLIHQAIDAVLIAFENINDNTNIKNIVQTDYYIRKSATESFLFDQKIPTLTDNELTFKADGFIEKFDGFRKFSASLKHANGIVDTKNSIEFKLINNNTNCDLVKWKVKNDNNSREPRGEITDNKTLQKTEKTAYIGNHYAECFAIKNNICIAKDKVDVIVKQ